MQPRLHAIIVALTCSLTASAPADPVMFAASDFVTLPIRVLLPDNSPAPATTVTLRSMERTALRDPLQNYDWTPAITDQSGSATLHYPTALVSTSQSTRGWPILPIYATIQPAANHAGAIIALPDSAPAGESLTIKIDDGYTLRGKVLLPDGNPLAGHPISINHDLKAESHTGHGGEIWTRRTQTAEDGTFTFTHVNPSPVTIQLHGSSTFYWADTIINGTRTHDCTDEFQPPWNNSENHFEIILKKSPAKTYEGIAVDEHGKPVAGATVYIGYSYHKEERTWADTHSSETTQTLADGTWKLQIPTKWATWGEIRQPGKPGPQAGTATIAARGGINLHITAPQTVHLTPDDSGQLMSAPQNNTQSSR